MGMPRRRPRPGGTTVLKGPFETEAAAEQALSPAEQERLGTPGQGRGKAAEAATAKTDSPVRLDQPPRGLINPIRIK